MIKLLDSVPVHYPGHRPRGRQEVWATKRHTRVVQAAVKALTSEHAIPEIADVTTDGETTIITFSDPTQARQALLEIAYRVGEMLGCSGR